MDNAKLKEKINLTISNILKEKNFVSPIDVLINIELLSTKDLENWRHGRVPYLEKVCKTNLGKLSFIMKELRVYAHINNLKPSWTAYNQWGTKGRKIPLRFSKFGVRDIEDAYATHYVVTVNHKCNMMRKKQSLNLSLDEATQGIYTESASLKISYKLKELFDYCKSKGIKDPSELSEEELKRFESK